MPKKCPECGQPPAEKGLIVCDKCKVPFVEALSPTYLAPESIKQVASAVVKSWKFWVPCLGLIFIGQLSVLKFVASLATKQTEKALRELKANTQARLDDTYKEMTNRINLEFQEPSISNIVVAVASNQASNMMQKQIAPEIKKFQDSLSTIMTDTATNIFANAVSESIDATQTNKFFVAQVRSNLWYITLKLDYAPIYGSVQATVVDKTGISLLMPHPLQGPIRTERNVLFHGLVGEWHFNTVVYNLQYVRDLRETNLVKKVEYRGKDIYLDDKLVEVADPDSKP
jgi:F0F1-type ATP synthase membrane subunit b/b'